MLRRVTISTVGLGQDVNRAYLEKKSLTFAWGKSYFLNEPAGLEQILLRDVMEHTGTTAVEKPLPPKVLKQTEILDGVAMDSAPALKGYVKFIGKPTAETDSRDRPRSAAGTLAVLGWDGRLYSPRTREGAVGDGLGHMEELRQILDQSEPRSVAARAGGRGERRVRQRQRDPVVEYLGWGAMLKSRRTLPEIFVFARMGFRNRSR